MRMRKRAERPEQNATPGAPRTTLKRLRWAAIPAAITAIIAARRAALKRRG